MVPTFEQWCLSVQVRPTVNPVLLSHYRGRVDAQRGVVPATKEKESGLTRNCGGSRRG
jgi:hypothetical protein